MKKNPSTLLNEDWRGFVKKHSPPGVDIGNQPSDELSGDEVSDLISAYEESEAAGKERVCEKLWEVLQSRQERVQSSIESLKSASSRAEIQHAEKRQAALSEESEIRGTRLGRNLYLIYEFLARVTYDQLAALTGLSRSSLHKIGMGDRVPTLTSLYQIAIGLSVPPTILLADHRTLRAWYELLEADDVLKTRMSAFETPGSSKATPIPNTSEKMNTRLFGTEDDEHFDPALWADTVAETAQDVSSYYDDQSALLSAVIGRHYTGEPGGFLAAHIANTLRVEVEYDDLKGFKFPGHFVQDRIQESFDTVYL